MAITTALTQDCVPYSGGLQRLYLVDKADVTSMTLTAQQYTAITMVATKVFREFEFTEDLAERRETQTRSDSGSISVAAEIEFFIKGLTNTTRTSIAEIAASSTCGMIVIAVDFQGTKWVHGYGEISKRAMKLATGTGTSGKKLDDSIGTTVILNNMTPELARVYTGTVPV